MFESITPELAGISSEAVKGYVSMLESRNLSVHSLLMMKGDAVFGEFYWAPFHKDFCHRMYSQTKSLVGIAVGLLAEDGRIDLDDPIATYFPEKITEPLSAEMARLTIRQMLTMTTCGPCKSWFKEKAKDRTRLYFQPRDHYHPAGTQWAYDSAGSQVLSALVEKISGTSLFDFLNQRIFSHLGSFQTAEILKTPNGDSWGDSALVCTQRDIASFGRLLMKKGKWEGKQLVNEDYVTKACSPLVDNRQNGSEGVFTHGYGYQIWQTERGAFAFNGMGGQFTVCFPKENLLLSITGDNQGNKAVASIVIGGFIDWILSPMKDSPLPENSKAYECLIEKGKTLSLRAVTGQKDSPFRKLLNERIYLCPENPTGITRFSFTFQDETKGVFRYTNAQGDKEIPFGVNRNLFGHFPQYGYSNECGVDPANDPKFLYRDAVSLCWSGEQRILLLVQIIDRYFGNLSVSIGFSEDAAVCHLEKNAENFLSEYQGDFIATRAKESP